RRNGAEAVNYIGVFGNDVQETGIPADVWRFYMFWNRPERSDVNFSWADFQEKVNGELIGNLSNLVNRTLTFVSRFYDGSIPEGVPDDDLVKAIREKEETITNLLERAEERDALREIFALSDIGNKAFQAGEPWKTRKEAPEKAASLLRTLCFLIRDLAVMISPYMPVTSEQILSFLSAEGSDWKCVGSFEGIEKVQGVTLLFSKLEDKFIGELRNRYSGSQEERQSENKEEKKAKEEKKMTVEETKEMSIADQFAHKVILKVSKIVNVEKHPNGDILYILKLNCGEEEERTIVSSIVPYYTADELLGHNIVLVSNLKPANFRGVKSYGMLLAASDPDAPEHTTCEVLFADEFEPGTVLEFDGEGDVEKITTYIKPDHFFALPIYTEDGVVKVDGKALGFGGKHLTAKKYVNGPVG
ncbi:MAG: class I tRNA ligase family protein, partial [Bullifex sp.]